MPKYKFKLPQGANIDTNKTNGAQPNQDFENFLPKISKPNPFLKIPNSRQT